MTMTACLEYFDNLSVVPQVSIYNQWQMGQDQKTLISAFV